MSVPDATYRFRGAPTSGDNSYLTLTSSGQVKGAALITDDADQTQKWKVTKRIDGYYDIINAGDSKPLSLALPAGDEVEYTLNVMDTSNATSWDISADSSGGMVLKPTSPSFNSKVADLSAFDRVVLWESNNLTNQSWVLEPVKPKIQLAWIAASNGSVPEGAVQGGYDYDGKALYVAHGIIDPVVASQGNQVGWQPGKAGTQLANVGGCIVGCNWLENNRSNYEVLVGDPSLWVWVPYAAGGKFTLDNVIYNGKKMTPIQTGLGGGGPFYSAQAVIKNALICGKVTAHNGGAIHITYDGAEHQWSGAFNVLCYA